MSNVYAVYMALLVALGAAELWALWAIKQNVARHRHRKRVRAARHEEIIERRLHRVAA